MIRFRHQQRGGARRLDSVDRWLALLRLVALVGAAIWWVSHPLFHGPGDHFAWILGVFAAYSALLYVVNALRPGHLRAIYRIAMVLDLAFVFILVRMTGGMASSFYLAFHLLIALHAFYFGLATGAGLAAAVTVIYPFTDVWPPPAPIADLFLRAGFFLLVGVCMGALAERERRERRLVEQLNRELRERQERLGEAHQQLIRSDRLATVGELAAGLAHDLRNPLAGVSAALHVLSGQFPEDDARQQILGEIQIQIARMNKTLTDLLWHARPPRPQHVPLDVNEVVEQSLWFLPIASGNGIEVVKRFQADLPRLRLDPNLLHQALLNILVNAHQAMPKGGRLTVGTSRRGGEDTVEITVADTGTGISGDHLGRIFQPFFTTKAEGTGLGLAIAHRIVEQHRGRITVESEAGKGTTFRITLPIVAPDQARSEDNAVETSRR